MKAAILSVTIVLLGTLCSLGQSKMDVWPEMKAYSSVLNETFVPSEKGDLKPIKTRSHELATTAKMITASPLPQEFDNEKVRAALTRLIKESDKLNALIVRQEQDMTIVKQLNKVENIYNELSGLCVKKEASNP